MKRLYMEKLVSIPKQCSVEFNDKVLNFEGPLGKQHYDISNERYTVDIVDGHIRLASWYGDRKKNARLGTIASKIQNHTVGVVNGFRYEMRAAYRHFSINMAILNGGKTVSIKNFLGAKDTMLFPVRGNAKARIGEHKDILIIEGTDIDDVSQTAAHIRNTCAKRKMHDGRIFLDGIYVENKTAIQE
ncbi:large subunit ribosomal protein L9e [Pancytospora philotis]|nr:large subunit ribosomal protein L9e [Pancytospora philotis]